MTFKEAIYDIREGLKLLSIDSDFTDRQIAFLLRTYRGTVIRQFLTNNPGEHRDILTQTLYMVLEDVDLSRFPDEIQNTTTLRGSIKTIPNIIGQQMYKEIVVRTVERLGKEIEIVHKDRAQFYLYAPKGFIYGYVDDDSKLYLISSDPVYKNIGQVTVTAIFEDPEAIIDINELSGDLDLYPITSHLWASVKSMTLEHIARQLSLPIDTINDKADEQLSQNTQK